jgi:hypothetical protein
MALDVFSSVRNLFKPEDLTIDNFVFQVKKNGEKICTVFCCCLHRQQIEPSCASWWGGGEGGRSNEGKWARVLKNCTLVSWFLAAGGLVLAHKLQVQKIQSSAKACLSLQKYYTFCFKVSLPDKNTLQVVSVFTLSRHKINFFANLP